MSAIDDAEIAAVQQAAPREVLTLRLGEEEYGIDILRVQEIRSYEPPTRIANAPAHLLGVLNLRGVIVPVVDLRHRLGLPAAIDVATVTIVVNVAGRTFGAVVDAVSDVVALLPAQIKPAPVFSGAVDARHITGIGVVETGEGQRMLILLAIERLLALADLHVIQDAEALA
jgi:purine-binding chemotaxis protein CheW